MLERYRKTGGFVQLLYLLETCEPAKREKFLKMIHDEDAGWAEAAEKKILSMAKICKWGTEVLAEIFGQLHDITLATVLHGLEAGERERWLQAMQFAQRRKVQEAFDLKKPSAGEVFTMNNKFIETTRKMISENRLRMDKIDPEMAIEDDIEEKLKNVATAAMTAHLEETSDIPVEVVTSSAKGHSDDEVLLLKKKVNVLIQENAQLKSELVKIRHKLEQIRKIV